MADQFINIFRERFATHEADVPAGAWENISSQLGGAEGSFRESLQRKFEGHEVDVDPGAWAQISGQLATTGTAATGTGLGAGWIAAGIAAVAITAGALLWPTPPGQTQNATPVTTVESLETAAAQAQTAVAVDPEQAMPAHSGEQAQPAEAIAAPALKKAMPAVAPKTGRHAQRNPQDTGDAEEKRAAALETADTPAQTEASPGTESNAATPVPATAPPAPVAQANDGPPVTPAQRTTTMNQPPSVPEETMQPVQAGNETAPATADDPLATLEESNLIMIPNVFSPQGDGINDKLMVVARNYEHVDVKVFSTKTGALVFHTNDLSNMWDGRLPNGNNADEGYYRCVVRITGANGKPEIKTEVVRLYR